MTTQSPELEPLLLQPREDGNQSLLVRPEADRQRYRAHPYWIIPIVLVVNIARGMTLAPRINVFTDIACRAVDSANLSSLGKILAQDCESPAVAARASKVQASVLTIMNILSSASTGLWSQYGDVKGRKIIFYVSIAGFIAMELIFVLVSGSNTAITSRAELFILIGPVLEGFAGGLSVFNGVVHAYVSDCSPDGSRSRIFSVIQGMVFVGLAIGPSIAGILLSYTSLGVYSMFHISIAIQFFFFFPESLRNKEQPPSRSPIDLPVVSSVSSPKSIREYFKRLTAAFMSPITIFRPRRVERGTTSRMDYNVTLMGLAMFLYITSTAVYPLKYLYGRRTFTWDPKHLGYYMSLLWICRATNLFFVLPLIEEIASELNFDKRLAQGSLFVDALADTFESGRLFGAIGVLNAISHSISPGLFALTYSITVETHPKTIFVLAATLLCTSVFLLNFIRARGW
ncbi:hypothetical protein C8F01DRAFT_1119920 [Mycena amicta]|nr:hypothetical protein C8F01DRAFT_1119920 [Mycena amicta]